MWTHIRNHRGQWALTVISGLLLSLAFPKMDQGYLAWCALAPLLLALKQATWREGFGFGLVFGLVHFLGLLYWTAYTMHVYGLVPLLQSICALILLAAILAVFYSAVFAAAVCGLCRKPWQLAVLGPALWVLLEWVRTWLFTGFPWELLGYSQYNRLWLIQIVDVVGVPGVSALLVFANVLLTLAILRWANKSWQGQGVSQTMLVRSAAVLAGALVLTAGYGVYRIHATDQLTAAAPTAEVAVIQGNIDQAHKWDTAFQVSTTAKYNKLSLQAAQEGVDLIVWPETAVPFYLFYDDALTNMVIQGIHAAGTDFIIGSPSAEIRGKEYLSYNSAYLFSPQGQVLDKYDKVHLVPFGEYVPLKRWLPFVKKLVAQAGEFQAGSLGNTLHWREHPIGMLVCYEAIFPDLARAMVKNKAQLLINITNDAWFGRTSAAYQHFSMAIFRCVENRRFMARSANTGISGFIDPCGRIISQTPLYEDRALVGKVSFLTSQTLYTRWGDWPLMVLCIGLVIAVSVRHLMRTQRELKIN